MMTSNNYGIMFGVCVRRILCLVGADPAGRVVKYLENELCRKGGSPPRRC